MTPEILSGLRSLLIGLGGYFVAQGWIDAAGLETVAAGLVVIAAAAWGIWAKRPSSTEAKKVAEKVIEAEDTPVDSSKSGDGQL